MSKDVPLSALEPVIRDTLNEGGTVAFTPTGTSMQPLLRNGKDQVTLEKVQRKPKKYDIYLYQREDGTFVLHRLVKVKGDVLTFRGDNQYENETGIKKDNLIGLVRGIKREKKTVNLKGFKYQLYERVWVNTVGLRRLAGKIKRKLYGLSIKKKIIYYSYMVIIPILLLICSIYVACNFEKVRESREEECYNSILSVSDSMELLMSDVNNLSNYIAINQEVLKILSSNDPQKLNENSRLWTEDAPMQMVEDMMALKGYIKTVAIYPENGVKPYLHCTDVTSHLSTLESLKKTDCYQDAVSKKGKGTWICIKKEGGEIYLSSRSDKMVLYREVFDLAKKKPLAFLAIGIPSEYAMNLCNKALHNSEEGIIVYSRNGEKMFQQGTIDPEAEEQFEAMEYFEKDYGQRETLVRIGDYELYIQQTSRTSPVICKIVPEIKWTDYLGEILYMPLGLLFGILVGLLPVLIFVSNIVSRPLQKVCKAMGKFRRGDFEQQVSVKTRDEVGEVASCFNKMVVDIRKLIDKNYVLALKEKESELAVLQAQINPHFLYNTLDALYWQACSDGNEDIAENVYSLSQLFRLVLGQGKDIVIIEDEVELARRYLEIQKMKFGIKVSYEIEVDEEIKEKKIPKLLLQPFIENAVVHGIGNSTENCRIMITCRKKEDMAEFIIQDTGIGMADEQIEHIWNQQPKEHRSGHRIGGYAIYNVKERLELMYHDHYTLEITSKEGEGTKVLICIPLEEEDRRTCH